MHIILMCRSLTTAHKAARILQKAGIFASVTKAPQSVNPLGCTYGVKIAERNRFSATQLLENGGIHIERVLESPERTRFGGDI